MHSKESVGLNSILNYDLVAFSDIFPHPKSGFSYAEFSTYLHDMPSASVIATGEFVQLLGSESIEQLIADFKEKNPLVIDRLHKMDTHTSLNTKLLYGIFLHITYHLIMPIAEKYEIPFIFTLYPGGTFKLNDSISDSKLKRIFMSKSFKKVIVTQKLTRDYLLSKGFCKENDIEFIFGVVTSPEKLALNNKNKKHYGFEKETLDICFTAFKNTEFGEDKGYDVFIEVAKELSAHHDNIRFHVVGPWDENVIDVKGIKSITFYGTQSQDWFDEFYSDKDLILSPNRSDKLGEGSFDGFPTGCLTDAALRKVAMFGTDPLDLNNGVFDGEVDFVFIKPDADDIVSKIKFYYDNPDKLKTLSENGQRKVKDLYSYKKQLQPRIDIINSTMHNLNHKQIDFSMMDEVLVSHLFVDVGDGFNESNKITESAQISSNGFFYAYFESYDKMDVKALRFDPDEGRSWDIAIESVLIDGKAYQATAQNSIGKSDEYDSFLTHDPIYHLTIPERFEVVEICGKIRPLSISIDDIVKENTMLKERISEKNVQPNNHSSKLMKLKKLVPEPLRALYRKLK